MRQEEEEEEGEGTPDSRTIQSSTTAASGPVYDEEGMRKKLEQARVLVLNPSSALAD